MKAKWVSRVQWHSLSLSIAIFINEPLSICFSSNLITLWTGVSVCSNVITNHANANRYIRLAQRHVHSYTHMRWDSRWGDLRYQITVFVTPPSSSNERNGIYSSLILWPGNEVTCRCHKENKNNSASFWHPNSEFPIFYVYSVAYLIVNCAVSREIFLSLYNDVNTLNVCACC